MKVLNKLLVLFFLVFFCALFFLNSAGDALPVPADLFLRFDPLIGLAGWLAFDLNERWDEGQTRAHLAQAFELYGQRGTVAGLRSALRIYAGVEMGPCLHEVKAPSLVLTGENDGGCNPRLNTLIHEALPNSELVILPHVKHSILVEAADAVSDHLIRFMSR
jgi:phage tail-like protein